MKNIYLLNLLKCKSCKFVFVFGFFLAYYLLPEAIFHQTSRILALIYMLVFAMLLMCMTRTVKNRVQLARKSGVSMLGIIGAVIGISAFQVCGIGAPVCGMTVGMGVLSTIFPGFMINFLTDYGDVLIYFSLATQLLALYFLKCFKIDARASRS